MSDDWERELRWLSELGVLLSDCAEALAEEQSVMQPVVQQALTRNYQLQVLVARRLQHMVSHPGQTTETSEHGLGDQQRTVHQLRRSLSALRSPVRAFRPGRPGLRPEQIESAFTEPFAKLYIFLGPNEFPDDDPPPPPPAGR